MRKLPIFLLSAALLCVGTAQAQVQVPPTAPPTTAEIAGFAADYLERAGGNAILFYGRSQSPMPGNLESMYLSDRNGKDYNDLGMEEFPKPVSFEESYSVGDIFYDGVLYPDVRMRLDLHRDQMVVTQPGGLSVVGIVVDPERFGWADLRGYRIVHLPAPVADTDLPRGYYMQLNDGRHRVLKKERFDLDTGKTVFNRRSIRYYIEKDGVFHSVGKSKGSVLRLLGDHRVELNRYVRTRGIRVRRHTERALVDIVDEYERLNEGGR